MRDKHYTDSSWGWSSGS